MYASTKNNRMKRHDHVEEAGNNLAADNKNLSCCSNRRKIVFHLGRKRIFYIVKVDRFCRCLKQTGVFVEILRHMYSIALIILLRQLRKSEMFYLRL